MDMLFIQGLLGLGFIGLGIYRFLTVDVARNRQIRKKSARPLEAWERGYNTLSAIVVLIGLFLIVVSFASVFAPQPPAGEYICLPTSTASTDENTFMTLKGDGTGTYDGQIFTWTLVNKTPIQVVFGGQTDLTLGAFPVADDSKSFVVEKTSGERQLCLLR